MEKHCVNFQWVSHLWSTLMTPRNGQRQLQPSVKNQGHSGLRKSKDCEEVMMKDSLGTDSARPLSPECGRWSMVRNQIVYVHCFCNSECINKFLLYYVSWSMCIAEEILPLTFLILMVAFTISTPFSVHFLSYRSISFLRLLFKGVGDIWKLKSITLRYIKVIWFLFICSSNGGVLLYIKRT